MGGPAACDLTPLQPLSYREAFYLELSYAEGYAEIAYDYLGEIAGDMCCFDPPI